MFCKRSRPFFLFFLLFVFLLVLTSVLGRPEETHQRCTDDGIIRDKRLSPLSSSSSSYGVDGGDSNDDVNENVADIGCNNDGNSEPGSGRNSYNANEKKNDNLDILNGRKSVENEDHGEVQRDNIDNIGSQDVNSKFPLSNDDNEKLSASMIFVSPETQKWTTESAASSRSIATGKPKKQYISYTSEETISWDRSISMSQSHGLRILTAEVAEADRSGRVIASLKKDLPRKTFSGKDAPTDFRLSDNDYREGLIIIGLPLVCLGGLFLLVGMCFCTCRLCCDGCGGTDPNPKNPYSPNWRMCFMVTLWLLSVLMMLGAVVGFLATFKIHSEASKTFSALEDTILEQKAAGEGTYGTIVESKTGGRNDAFDPFVNAVRNVSDASLQNVNQVTSYEAYRHFLIIFGMTVSSLGALSSFFAPPCQSTGLSKLAALAGFVSLSLLWLAFGILLPFTIAVEDFCVSVARLNDEYAPNSTATVTVRPGDLFFADCVDKEVVTLGFNLTIHAIDDIVSGIDDNVYATNSKIRPEKIEIDFYFDPTLPVDPQLEALGKNATALEERLKGPPFDLNSPTYELYYDTLTSAVNDIRLFPGMIEDLRQLGACGFAVKAYRSMHDTVCQVTIDPFDNLLAAVFFTAAFWIPGTIIAILGGKRFAKLARVAPAPAAGAKGGATPAGGAGAGAAAAAGGGAIAMTAVVAGGNAGTPRADAALDKKSKKTKKKKSGDDDSSSTSSSSSSSSSYLRGRKKATPVTKGSTPSKDKLRVGAVAAIGLSKINTTGNKSSKDKKDANTTKKSGGVDATPTAPGKGKGKGLPGKGLPGKALPGKSVTSNSSNSNNSSSSNNNINKSNNTTAKKSNNLLGKSAVAIGGAAAAGAAAAKSSPDGKKIDKDKGKGKGKGKESPGNGKGKSDGDGKWKKPDPLNTTFSPPSSTPSPTSSPRSPSSKGKDMNDTKTKLSNSETVGKGGNSATSKDKAKGDDAKSPGNKINAASGSKKSGDSSKPKLAKQETRVLLSQQQASMLI